VRFGITEDQFRYGVPNDNSTIVDVIERARLSAGQIAELRERAGVVLPEPAI
jgi:hypothetical protein